ncbi:FKBP-type peptidyl-prolyl cis-trans isomerase [Acidihalobacter yilgarnensis]|uniref:FKBP-type peptidyl-prolyl cis-trans isomerase n=1 Tax=Acidihalobacter yilgarnensis TaxID=2819280 RepID=UPI001E4AF078|nr:FKBP-type peptidyl-prolyl cis-trans isomerase [Acidihalobacter yilgarnensis]
MNDKTDTKVGTSPRVIGPHSRVRLHYAITLEDGTVADATVGEMPLEIELGSGALHPNLERLLLGRVAGSSDVVVLPPEHGFGARDPAQIQTLPRHDFPPDMNLAPGDIVGFTTPGGDELPGAVIELDDSAVTLDFNHPFAGHTLSIGLNIIDVDE